MEQASYKLQSKEQEPPASTFLRMPNELLAEIFRVYVEPRSLDALTLSHVCQNWRNFTIGLTELWSSIGIHRGEDTESFGTVALTVLYLERSGSSPLDIFIDEPSPEILFICGEHSSRWRFLHFSADWALCNEVLYAKSPFSLVRIRGRLPLLEKLVIEWQDGVGQEGPYNLELDLFLDAPRLSTLEVNLPETIMQSFAQRTPKHFTFPGYDTVDAYRILRFHTHVQTAKFIDLVNMNNEEPYERCH